MLILSRKENEGICLGDGITVKVVSIAKGVVKLGIEAPKEVLILRSELAEAVKQSNLVASGDVPKETLETLSKRLKVKQ